MTILKRDRKTTLSVTVSARRPEGVVLDAEGMLPIKYGRKLNTLFGYEHIAGSLHVNTEAKTLDVSDIQSSDVGYVIIANVTDNMDADDPDKTIVIVRIDGEPAIEIPYRGICLFMPTGDISLIKKTADPAYLYVDYYIFTRPYIDEIPI